MRFHLITGPTGAGKTAVAIRLATELGAPVVVLDRIQCFPEMATTSGRPDATELNGTRRLYLDDRRVSQGDLTADQAIVRLDELLHDLSCESDLILEGGSISLLTLMCARRTLPTDTTVHLIAPDAGTLRYGAAVRKRVSHMLTTSPSLLDELAHCWQYETQREFVAGICGFDAVIARSRKRNVPVAEISRAGEDITELVELITRAHLGYARQQSAWLREADLPGQFTLARTHPVS